MSFQTIFVFSCILFIESTQADAGQQKRVLLHSNDDLAAALQLLTAEVNQLTTQNNQLVAKITQFETQINQQKLDIATLSSSPKGGFTAGSIYTEQGAADYLCLTSQPLWGVFDDSPQTYSAKIYGTEYQFFEQGYQQAGAEFFGKDLHNHDAPCAVCRTSRETTIMIPGRNQCFEGWTKEYAGYLVSGEWSGSVSGDNYACLDANAEVVTGDYQANMGKLMYTVEAVCGSLRCPPYVQYREITCVVCSK